MRFSTAQVHLNKRWKNSGSLKSEHNTPEENSGDASNWFAVKAMTVALTFPVTAETYWSVNHLLEGLNQGIFS